ncbi:hypothetical protein LUZ63_019892 [Rhynchospora breviuscula]|uniref:Bifunctional inhibitor/plant lipid transfer protein/seed storage helical domain-containing protein n=1 Tax=Rhynchospora breviuscula TaxID=2022672 RepID=A0A9Q0C727_9POAL|nr:hypothetical protein LUZ63_019892 [Rhynchospora breviuscula]
MTALIVAAVVVLACKPSRKMGAFCHPPPDSTTCCSAVICGDVMSAVAPCLAYARSGQGSPSAGCCSCVKSKNSKAVTGTNRQIVCNCLKNLANTMTFNAGAVAGLPGGVSTQYSLCHHHLHQLLQGALRRLQILRRN